MSENGDENTRESSSVKLAFMGYKSLLAKGFFAETGIAGMIACLPSVFA